MRVQLRLIALVTGMALCFFSGQSFSQSARALFANSAGVTFKTQLKDAEPKQKPAADKQAYSGLSYKIMQEFPGGELRQVSPGKVFRTGDRIKVVLTSNKTGELSVSNINPAGQLSNVAQQSVVAEVPFSVPANGLLKFVGEKGTEQLIFVLSKVSLANQAKELGSPLTTILRSCFQNKGTRSLVVDDSAGNEVGIVNKKGSCDDPGAGTTRSLVVEVADNAGYAVIPESALADGQMLTLKINLRHQ